MNHPHEFPLLQQLQNEQGSIQEAIREWRQWWHDLKELGKPHFGEMGLYLRKIRERMLAHFQHEEDSGFLKQLVVEADAEPETESRLLAEHQQILQKLQALIDRLQCCEHGEISWSGARAEFDQILEQVKNHEQQELQLGQAAVVPPCGTECELKNK